MCFHSSSDNSESVLWCVQDQSLTMPVVAFTLNEEGIVTLQNALACLLKFSEEAFVEAKKDKVRCFCPSPWLNGSRN